MSTVADIGRHLSYLQSQYAEAHRVLQALLRQEATENPLEEFWTLEFRCAHQLDREPAPDHHKLRDYYESDVNHGRLYSNLDELDEAGFIAKGRKDQRTNAYEITNAGREVLDSEVAWLVERTKSFEEGD